MKSPSPLGSGLLVVGSAAYPPFDASFRQVSRYEVSPQDLLDMEILILKKILQKTTATLIHWSGKAPQATIKLCDMVENRPLFAFGDEKPLDQVTALQLGADDYLIPPISPLIFEAKLNAFYRRLPGNPHHAPGTLAFYLDPTMRKLCSNVASVQLRNKEYQLMECLLRDPGNICSSETLLNDVWGIDFDTGTNPLAVQISALRKKLRQLGLPNAIETQRGVGYRLNSRVVMRSGYEGIRSK